MTRNQIIERGLRKAGVFPPSVMDGHYRDKDELTKAEIILKSLEEMGVLPLSDHDARFTDKLRWIHIVTAELQLRLPDGEITTCGAFSALGAGCCDACHTDPLHGMNLVELPGCNWAWLCCAVDAASSPEPILILHERDKDSPEGEKFHDGPCDHAGQVD